jgi:peptidoglycan/LPS O-acetylase OafA/YrhL
MASVALPFADQPSEGVVVARRAPLQIPSLDGLRAAAFLLVFVSHAGGIHTVIPGAFGVTVFFFLSGYLITTLMRVEADTTGRVSLTDFYLRRVLRILPPFYVVLVAATVLAEMGVLGGNLQPRAVASQFFHFSNYWIAAHGGSGVATGTGVYWSLAVEEHFYLLFPAIFIGLSRLRLTGRQKALAFWGMCAVFLAWRCVLVFVLRAGVDRVQLCSDTRFDSIAFGCALAVWNNPALDGVGGRSQSAVRSGLACSAGVGLLLVTFVVRAPAFRETLRYTLQGVALTPIFIAAVRHPRWPVFRLLNWRPMRFIGNLSYSLYLVHHIVLIAIAERSRLGATGCALVAAPVSLAIAWAIYAFVEKPCARLRRRLSVTPRGGHTELQIAPTPEAFCRQGAADDEARAAECAATH